ncbi:MAG: methyltransferase domain-containing protein, partial [Myxococcales bacterium]
MLPTASVDRAFGALLRLGRHLPALTLEGQALGPARRAALRRLVTRHRPVVDDLSPLIVEGDLEAIAAYDALMTEAMGELRRHDAGGVVGALGQLDRRTLLPREEYCDRDDCPPDERRHILAFIDWLNEHLGSYPLWRELLGDDLRPVSDRAPRLLDLAAGPGGFMLSLKERLGDAIEATASDVYEEYLTMGRAEADRRGLDVDFIVQDATDLRPLAADAYDVIVCTQSIHHFSPGMVGRLAGEAARRAGRAVWLIDAERSLLAAGLVGLVAAGRGRSWPVVHDTVVSLRKMYAEEELALMGALTPGLPPGARVSTGRRAPGFAYLRIGLG